VELDWRSIDISHLGAKIPFDPINTGAVSPALVAEQPRKTDSNWGG
jgi:hypothetical protein